MLKIILKRLFVITFVSFLGTSSPILSIVDWCTLYLNYLLDLSFLDSHFTEEEIKEAIFSLEKDKSPELDGFQASFYKKYQDTFESNILKLFSDFYDGSSDLSRLNYSYIDLILKKYDVATIQDFRPINIKHGMIKIISKVLSLRL